MINEPAEDVPRLLGKWLAIYTPDFSPATTEYLKATPCNPRE